MARKYSPAEAQRLTDAGQQIDPKDIDPNTSGDSLTTVQAAPQVAVASAAPMGMPGLTPGPGVAMGVPQVALAPQTPVATPQPSVSAGNPSGASMRPMGQYPGHGGAQGMAAEKPDTVKSLVLNRIRHGEAGSYDELYGGGHFSDFSQFPQWEGQMVNGRPTHAAGFYQFEPATWKAQAAKLGLKDFSPASQDAAAWNLAQETYKQATGGQDLYTDAANGNVKWSALGSQWASLAGAKSGPGMDGTTAPTSGGTSEHTPAQADTSGQPTTTTDQAQNPDPNGLANPKTMQALMLYSMLAPSHQFTPVAYDPFKAVAVMK